MVVNDVHSKLNPTRPALVRRVDTPEDLQAGIAEARHRGLTVSVAGGRHAMGGQQFGRGHLLLDSTGMHRVLHLDRARGLVTVQAGIQWPELVAELHRLQAGEPGEPWTIAQKQTGADRFSVGGSVSANAHGRGLTMAPIVDDVEALELIGPEGATLACSRTRHPDLFACVVGGYGLFGALATVTLRLVRRHVLERVVEVRSVTGLTDAFAGRIADGFTYGDFQFAIDPASADFLQTGVFSCYRPVPGASVPAGQRALDAADWTALLALAHTDKSRAFTAYAEHYLATSGQRYRSDDHQFATYLDDYHAELDRVLQPATPGTEMITELSVPCGALEAFLGALAATLRRRDADLIYGTVRLIEPDDVTVLPWARGRWACVVLNLHVPHTPRGRAEAAETFRTLIDVALRFGGTYYLTYHRYARADQVLAAHPRFTGFLRRKRAWDPDERFGSDWYRHHRRLLAVEVPDSRRRPPPHRGATPPVRPSRREGAGFRR